MVFKRYTHTTATKQSLAGPYSGVKVPKRRIIKDRSYYLPAEEGDDEPYAYMESSDEMEESIPATVNKKQGKKRKSTSKISQPVKKRRIKQHVEYSDASDDDDDDDDDDEDYEDATGEDNNKDYSSEDEEQVVKTKSKKKQKKKVKRQQLQNKKRPVTDETNDDDDDDDHDDDDNGDNEHHGRDLEFVKPKKMSVSMKLKQEEQKVQKAEESESEDPEIIVKKLNNLGTVIKDKQSASVLELKNTDISLITSTLKGVLDAQLPNIPDLDKEELKRFCKSKTTLKEKKRMLMNSQFLTPVGKYLSLLEIDK